MFFLEDRLRHTPVHGPSFKHVRWLLWNVLPDTVCALFLLVPGLQVSQHQIPLQEAGKESAV